MRAIARCGRRLLGKGQLTDRPDDAVQVGRSNSRNRLGAVVRRRQTNVSGASQLSFVARSREWPLHLRHRSLDRCSQRMARVPPCVCAGRRHPAQSSQTDATTAANHQRRYGDARSAKPAPTQRRVVGLGGDGRRTVCRQGYDRVEGYAGCTRRAGQVSGSRPNSGIPPGAVSRDRPVKDFLLREVPLVCQAGRAGTICAAFSVRRHP